VRTSSGGLAYVNTEFANAGQAVAARPSRHQSLYTSVRPLQLSANVTSSPPDKTAASFFRKCNGNACPLTLLSRAVSAPAPQRPARLQHERNHSIWSRGLSLNGFTSTPAGTPTMQITGGRLTCPNDPLLAALYGPTIVRRSFAHQQHQHSLYALSTGDLAGPAARI